MESLDAIVLSLSVHHQYNNGFWWDCGRTKIRTEVAKKIVNTKGHSEKWFDKSIANKAVDAEKTGYKNDNFLQLMAIIIPDDSVNCEVAKRRVWWCGRLTSIIQSVFIYTKRRILNYFVQQPEEKSLKMLPWDTRVKSGK